MNFNSLHFLIFLPVVLILYWVLPHKFRWVLLLIASYYFYMSWNVWLIFLMVATTGVSYGAGLAIEKTQSKKLKKFWLILTLIVCFGILIFFKYFNFLIASVIDFLNLFTMNIDSFSLDIILPIGISFYTFQTLSYVIDVYRGDYKAERHLGYYALFVCYFPQLVAGPIERPGDLIPQLKEKHRLNSDDMTRGFGIMLCGFFLKCAVADYIGIYVNNVFGNLSAANSFSVFAAGILFTLQMFGDFAGYSLIATGAARMMGVRLTRNFDRPYLAVSYGDFFHRWHITLSRWFSDYVYKPLGGSRKGKARRILNTFIVFLLCGLWHGANWTYVLWGLYAAIFISLESLLRKPVKAFLGKRKVDPHGQVITFLRRAAMWVIFVPAAILFRSSSVAQAGQAFATLFTAVGLSAQYFGSAFSSLGLDAFSLLFIALAITTMCFMDKFERYEPIRRELPALPPLPMTAAKRTLFAEKTAVHFYFVVVIALCWLALLQMGDSSVFLYFQF